MVEPIHWENVELLNKLHKEAPAKIKHLLQQKNRVRWGGGRVALFCALLFSFSMISSERRDTARRCDQNKAEENGQGNKGAVVRLSEET